MIVFVGGMPRSGSTYSFNIVRELLTARAQTYCEATDSPRPVVTRGGQAGHIVLKGHHLDEPGQQMIRDGEMQAICTVRDPFDAVASLMDVFGFTLEVATDGVSRWMKWYDGLQRSVLTLDYEDIGGDPGGLIRQIAAYLGLELSQGEEMRLSLAYNKSAVKARTDYLDRHGPHIVDAGFSYYGAEDLFHRGHVRSAGARQLTVEERSYVISAAPTVSRFLTGGRDRVG